MALLAWLTAAAVAIALLTLTGAATVAAALHRGYAAGWMCATVASALLLLLPLELEVRTVVALLCGPLLGIAVHLAVLARLPLLDRVFVRINLDMHYHDTWIVVPAYNEATSSATSSRTFAPFSTTWSVWTTAALTRRATLP